MCHTQQPCGRHGLSVLTLTGADSSLPRRMAALHPWQPSCSQCWFSSSMEQPEQPVARSDVRARGVIVRCRWDKDQTFNDVKVNIIESADIVDGTWYVIIKGDYTGRVTGSVYDLTDPQQPEQVELTPKWEKCKLPEQASEEASPEESASSRVWLHWPCKQCGKCILVGFLRRRNHATRGTMACKRRNSNHRIGIGLATSAVLSLAVDLGLT